MRAATSFRLLLLPAIVLLGIACDHADSPLEPPVAADEAPLSQEPASLATGRWADAYAFANAPTVASYTPNSELSYNRSGGSITITKPAGTTGRYLARFRGLSALIGTKSTVHVTSYGMDNAYCKPVGARLASDTIAVRCFNAANGTPANALFSLVVLGKTAGRAFAFAHLPTTASYTPSASGSWNPAGTIKVVRAYTGTYQVTFNNLGSQLPPGVGGHVQVNAVGTGQAHCRVADEWGGYGSPNVGISVQCWTLTGAPVDAKFTVLFQLPAAHLAYAYANQASTPAYSAEPFWSSNPTGKAIEIRRFATGDYEVRWQDADPEILGFGNVQVTPVGVNESGLCKFAGTGPASAVVRCFAPNGTPADTYFTVLLGS